MEKNTKIIIAVILFISVISVVYNVWMDKSNTPVVVEEAVDARKKESIKAEQKKAPEPEVVEEVVEEEPAEEEVELPTELSYQEFDKMFKRDPDEEQYIDGVFKLKDGSIWNADMISYVDDGDVFDYVIATFYDGKVADLHLETTNSIADVERGLGISFAEGVRVEPTRIGFKINFDERFDIDNIARLPNEWD